MKPASFEYHRVDTVEEAIARLGELGEDAKVLAGGQSLVPMMNFRLVRPSALVDITRIPDLKYVFRDGDALRIGALTLHAEVEAMSAPELANGFAVLPRTARWVGHYPIRTRGTFGGSLAHSDPSSEWCILSVLLDAEIVARGPGGERTIPASEFFQGFFMSALEPGEVLVEARFPRPAPHAALVEFARRHGDFGIVIAAVALELEEGRCRSARVVIGGVDEVPLRVRDAEDVLAGSGLDPEALEAAGEAAARAVDPPSDIHGSADYRRRLTGVLLRRAVAQALGGDAAEVQAVASGG